MYKKLHKRKMFENSRISRQGHNRAACRRLAWMGPGAGLGGRWWGGGPGRFWLAGLGRAARDPIIRRAFVLDIPPSRWGGQTCVYFSGGGEGVKLL